MLPCTGNRVNSNYERIASRVGAQFRTRASESQRHPSPPTVVSNVLTTRRWSTRQNGLTPAERYDPLQLMTSPHDLDTTKTYTNHYLSNLILMNSKFRCLKMGEYIIGNPFTNDLSFLFQILSNRFPRRMITILILHITRHMCTGFFFFVQNLFLPEKMEKRIKPVLTSFFHPKLSKTDQNWTKWWTVWLKWSVHSISELHFSRSRAKQKTFANAPKIRAGAGTTRVLVLPKIINMNILKTLYSNTTRVLIFQYS